MALSLFKSSWPTGYLATRTFIVTPRVEAQAETESKPKRGRKAKPLSAEDAEAAAAKLAAKELRARVKSLPPAPKPPKNSFVRFMEEFRQRNPGMAIREYFLQGSQEWRTLSEAEKAKYKATEEEHEAHRIKRAEWMKSLTAEDARAVRTFKRSKNRPSEYYRLTPFAFFVMAQKDLEIGSHETRMSHCAKLWNELSESEKKQWRQKSEAEQERRTAAYAEYMADKKKA